MKTVIIIPARFQSVRFPGKPLTKLNCGMGIKKSLIHLTWEAAKKVRGADEIFVATDDQRIYDAVNRFGGKAIMTSKSCKNGQITRKKISKSNRGYFILLNPI